MELGLSFSIGSNFFLQMVAKMLPSRSDVVSKLYSKDDEAKRQQVCLTVVYVIPTEITHRHRSNLHWNEGPFATGIVNEVLHRVFSLAEFCSTKLHNAGRCFMA